MIKGDVNSDLLQKNASTNLGEQGRKLKRFEYISFKEWHSLYDNDFIHEFPSKYLWSRCILMLQ